VFTISTSQKIRIKLNACNKALIDETSKRIVETVKINGSEVSGPVSLATDKNIITISWSNDKDTEVCEQFDNRPCKRLIDILSPTPTAVEALLQMELPEGVDIEIKL